MCYRLGLIGASIVGAVATLTTIGAGCPPEEIEYKHIPATEHSLPLLAMQAVSPHAPVADRARAALRAAGQGGLEALFDRFPNLAADATRTAAPTDPLTLRWIDAVEAVGRQRDGAFSRLYWYTDLDQALAQASETNRPVLSLRLLGNLDEDRSCANSRYFRTVLYADPSVADYLRDNYVLHWQSVRPVPHITIDFGDGRKIERTITGNSVHYVLNSDGRLIDAIPGLWAAEPFLDVLTQSTTTLSMREVEPSLFDTHLRWHSERSAEQLERLLIAFRVEPPEPGQGEEQVRMEAHRAMERALSKSGMERVFIQELAAVQQDLPDQVDFAPIAKAFPAQICEQSRMLMWQKRFGSAADTADLQQQRIMHTMFSTFERSLALDTVMNRFELRPSALRWIAEAGGSIELNAFNERVYAELFLTPLDDPWMGLVPDDAYAALDSEGLMDGSLP